jgi:hypothetical protein
MLVKNEGVSDRLVRAMLGGGLLAVSAVSFDVTIGRPLGITAAATGAILLFTATTGSCLLHRPLGVDTPKERNGSTE